MPWRFLPMGESLSALIGEPHTFRGARPEIREQSTSIEAQQTSLSCSDPPVLTLSPFEAKEVIAFGILEFGDDVAPLSEQPPRYLSAR